MSQRVRAFRWSLAGMVGRLSVQTVGAIAMARLLGPSEFGLGNVVAVIGVIVFAFVGSGFNAALITREIVSAPFLREVVCRNFALGAVSVVLLIAGRRDLAGILGLPRAADLLGWLVIGVFGVVMSGPAVALLTRSLRFDHLAVVETLGPLVGVMAGIGAVLGGAGALGFIIQLVVSEFSMGLIAIGFARLVASETVPVVENIDFGHAYSTNVALWVGSTQVSRNVDNVLIVKLVGPAQLGAYSVAYRLMTLPVMVVSTMLGRVSLPLVRQAIGTGVREADHEFARIIRAISLVTMPLAPAVWFFGAGMIHFVYGDSWDSAVMPFRILFLSVPLQALTSICGPTLQALGHASILWKTNVVLTFGVAGCALFSVFGGIVAVCWGFVGLSFLSLVWNLRLTAKALCVRPIVHWSRITPGIVAGVTCLAAGWMIVHIFPTRLDALDLLLALMVAAFGVTMAIRFSSSAVDGWRVWAAIFGSGSYPEDSPISS